MQTPFILKGFAAACLLAGAACFANYEISASAPIEGQQSMRLPATSIASRATRCAVEATAPETLDFFDKLASGSKDSGGIVTIPVYWHVITTAGGGGNASAFIPDQMQVLNEAFASSKFAFVLKGVQVVANDDWFFAEAGSPDEVAMKAALRKGGPDSLNIYTTNGDVYLGWATLAHNYKFAPSYDGVVLWWFAMPGTGLAGPNSNEPDGVLTYDQGDTGTHEVGHWLGLEHTFGPGNGCSRPGDKIKDTPTEAVPQFFCQPRDSCLGANNPGEDPITNFMDYVDDVCMDHFTADQSKRMRTHWHAFRNKKARQ